MKTKLLLAALLVAPALFAQTTHIIQWGMQITPEDAVLTIPQGDIVTWLWVDDVPHSVTSLEGTSTETFNSGLLTGQGQSFTHTFTLIGENPYNCTEHFWMSGSIIVTNVASAGHTALKPGIEIGPNPVADVVTINAAEAITAIKMYDMAGKQVFTANSSTNTVKLYIAPYASGIYVLHIESGGKTETRKIVKN